MNIQPINPPLRDGQKVRCCACGKWTSDAVADLNGPAFEAYYCPVCRPDRRIAFTRPEDKRS